MVKIGLICWKQGGGTNDYIKPHKQPSPPVIHMNGVRTGLPIAQPIGNDTAVVAPQIEISEILKLFKSSVNVAFGFKGV